MKCQRIKGMSKGRQPATGWDREEFPGKWHPFCPEQRPGRVRLDSLVLACQYPAENQVVTGFGIQAIG